MVVVIYRSSFFQRMCCNLAKCGAWDPIKIIKSHWQGLNPTERHPFVEVQWFYGATYWVLSSWKEGGDWVLRRKIIAIKRKRSAALRLASF